MSKSLAGLWRSPLFLFPLICAVIGLSAWSATSSPALASIMQSPSVLLGNLGSAPGPAHPQSFAQAYIAKPAYTASPPVLPPSTPANSIETVPTSALEFRSSGSRAYEETPAAPEYIGDKYILVDISEQHLYAYEGDALLYSFVASTGMNNATRVGTFSVLEKIPNAYGATWDIWMPNWLGIYWAGSTQNGIHALPILPNGAQIWEGYLGSPISYGCVVLSAYEAQLLYEWSDIGTPVEIRW